MLILDTSTNSDTLWNHPYIFLKANPMTTWADSQSLFDSKGGFNNIFEFNNTLAQIIFVHSSAHLRAILIST
jgi:hypothetical protein